MSLDIQISFPGIWETLHRLKIQICSWMNVCPFWQPISYLRLFTLNLGHKFNIHVPKFFMTLFTQLLPHQTRWDHPQKRSKSSMQMLKFTVFGAACFNVINMPELVSSGCLLLSNQYRLINLTLSFSRYPKIPHFRHLGSLSNPDIFSQQGLAGLEKILVGFTT